MPFDQRLIDYAPGYLHEPDEDFGWFWSPEAIAFIERMKHERITNEHRERGERKAPKADD